MLASLAAMALAQLTVPIINYQPVDGGGNQAVSKLYYSQTCAILSIAGLDAGVDGGGFWYGLQPVDALNPSRPTGPQIDAGPFSSPTDAGVSICVPNAAGSGAAVVSWSVTGYDPIWEGVTLSVVNSDAPISPIGFLDAGLVESSAFACNPLLSSCCYRTPAGCTVCDDGQNLVLSPLPDGGVVYAVGGLATDGGATLAGCLTWINGAQCCPNGPDAGLVCTMPDGGWMQVYGGGLSVNNDPVQLATNEALNLYVATTGNDHNSCLTSGTPCLTIQGAVNKIPKLIRNPVTVTVAAGTYSAGAYVSGFSFDPGNQTVSGTVGPELTIAGTNQQASLGGSMTGSIASATAANVGQLASLGSGSGAPSTWATATVTGAGWTVNALAKSMFCVTSGSDDGDCRIVYTNTATVVTLVGGWSFATPSASDSFEVETWNTTISGTLQRPAGVFGSNSHNATYGAGFFFAGNSSSPWFSGAGKSYGTANIFAGGAFPDPHFRVANFVFTPADTADAVSLSGDTSVAVTNCDLSTSGYLVAQMGGSLIADANVMLGDTYGAPMIWQNEADFTGNNGRSFAFVHGNYSTFDNSGGFNALVEINGGALVVQNYTTGVGSATEVGWTQEQGSASFEVGNIWNLLSRGGFQEGWLGGTAQIDGDTFTNCATAIGLQFSRVVVVGDALSGSGNTTGLSVNNGSWIDFHVADGDGMTSTTDISFEGTPYTLAQARAAVPEGYFDAATGNRISGTP